MGTRRDRRGSAGVPASASVRDPQSLERRVTLTSRRGEMSPTLTSRRGEMSPGAALQSPRRAGDCSAGQLRTAAQSTRPGGCWPAVNLIQLAGCQSSRAAGLGHSGKPPAAY